MEQLVDSTLRGGMTPPTVIDVFTVQVATVLWRIGRPASVAEMDALIAAAQGRPPLMTENERGLLDDTIAFHVAARSAQGLAMLIERADTERWGLTAVARSILGPYPGLAMAGGQRPGGRRGTAANGRRAPKTRH